MNLRSRNDYQRADDIEYAYLRTLSPAQTMREFVDLFDSFHDRIEDDGSLHDDHRSNLIQLQSRLQHGPATSVA